VILKFMRQINEKAQVRCLNLGYNMAWI
jgi:hypothetical protein